MARSEPAITHGSNHIRYVSADRVLRLTTDAPVSYLLVGNAVPARESASFCSGADETLADGVEQTAREFQEQTDLHWRQWTRRLCASARVAGGGDPRRDHAQALHLRGDRRDRRRHDDQHPGSAGQRSQLGLPLLLAARRLLRRARAQLAVAKSTRWNTTCATSANVVGNAPDGHLQPVYGIALERRLEERESPALAGYRGMGPVRVGNQAYEHLQHDVYGNVILATAQAFFDRRLLRPATMQDFTRLERVGEQA